MIKKTIYFGNPAYLSLRLSQLVVSTPRDADGKSDVQKTVPIEDIAMILLDNKQITITHGLLEKLLESGCSVVTCDSAHLPVGLMMPLCGNSLQNERFSNQIAASLPLKKQLWQQTIQAKIINQASVLQWVTGSVHNNMLKWSSQVRSGDPDNLEARAAAYYWKTMFVGVYDDFTRNREGGSPNDILNYGYAILRAIVARALVSSGLLPTLGIHHHNRYNAYCLADDIMEPYRPFVDKYVYQLVVEKNIRRVDTETKIKLLQIPTIDVNINGNCSPLMVATSTTSASLAKCFGGEIKRILYPVL